MSMYNLREYYLLLEEKDRKFRSSPNLHCALLFPWLELQVCQRAVPCWGVPLQLCQLLVAFGAIEAERRAVTIHLQTPVLLSSAPREVNPKYPDFLNLCFSALMRCQLCLFWSWHAVACPGERGCSQVISWSLTSYSRRWEQDFVVFYTRNSFLRKFFRGCLHILGNYKWIARGLRRMRPLFSSFLQWDAPEILAALSCLCELGQQTSVLASLCWGVWSSSIANTHSWAAKALSVVCLLLLNLSFQQCYCLY